MMKWRVWGGALAWTLAAPMAFAQAVIQSITSTQQAGADVVRIELSEALKAVPTGFTIQQPARIAIDLPGVGNAMGKPSVDINQGNLRSVSVAQAGDRTRLVLNLKQAATYRAQLDGNALLIVVDSAGPATAAAPAAAGATPAAATPAAATAAAPTTFATSQNRDPQSLREIDFRRGVDGAGRVIVTLPSNQVGVDIRQQGTGLLVEFPRSTVPDNLRRRLDVTDFGTPVQTVTTTQSGDRVRMVIEPRGNWEHSAYQSDTQFVVEVRPVKVDPNKLTQGPGYQGEKLSLNFQNIEVRSLLQVIADFTNFNVVTSDTVTGSLTLRLKDVPWDQALDIILQAKGLGLRKSGNVIWIAPKDELAIKEQADLEAGKKKSELEPLRTQSFQLNYTKAEDVAKGLGGSGGGQGGNTSTKILSARGSVISDQRTNQLFVTDIPSKLEEIQSLVARIDIPVRQVLIEARIVEANDTFGKSLGAKLGFVDLRGIRNGVPGWGVTGDNRVAVGGNYVGVGQITRQTPDGGDAYTNQQMINLPAIGQGGYNPASFALSIFGASSNRFLNLEISALEADGKGKVVSSPRIVTADQVKAFISQGTKVPFQRSTSSGATAIEFVEAALKLEVTPQITPEGNIIMDVKINKDSLGALTALGREINIKEVKTTVLVENGGTVVIGGIYEQQSNESVTKVPFLGDVPYLGNLFKTKTQDSQRTELLVFLTPKVVTEKAAVR